MRTDTLKNSKNGMALLHAHLRSRPAAVISSPRADADPKALLIELKAGFEAFKAKYDGKVDAMAKNFQASVDEMAARAAAMSLNGGVFTDAFDQVATDPEYTEQMRAYARGGQNFPALIAGYRDGARGALNASMSTGVGEAGGVLVPTEWDRRVQKSQRERSLLRQIADVQTWSAP